VSVEQQRNPTAVSAQAADGVIAIGIEFLKGRGETQLFELLMNELRACLLIPGGAGNINEGHGQTDYTITINCSDRCFCG
jgi:hypothetical protein